MTPEEAIRVARLLAGRFGRLCDEAESGALYAYVLALRSWRPDGGASLRRYCDRRMVGGAQEGARAELRRQRPTPCGALRGISAVSPIGWRRVSRDNDGDEESFVSLDRKAIYPCPDAPDDPAPILRKIAATVARSCARPSRYVPETERDRRSVARKVARARQSGQRAARIAWLYHGLGYSAREIGLMLTITESRVFQIIKEVRVACAG